MGEGDGAVNKVPLSDQGQVPLELAQRVDAVSDRFEAAWQAGPPPQIEDFLPDWETSDRLVLLRELLLLDLYHRRRAGQTPRLDAYRARFPELDQSWVAAAFNRLPTAPHQGDMASSKGSDKQVASENWQEIDAFVQRFEKAWQEGARPAIDDFLPKDGPDRLAVLQELVNVDIERRRMAGEPARTEDYLERYPELVPYRHGTLVHESHLQTPPQAGRATPPQQIGRYRVERALGRGGYGIVYLAHDDQLHRPVAIKVPHPHLLARPEDADAYLFEARTVAALEHPNIVPVHDVGTTADYPFFVVSKFIQGGTLARRLKEYRPSVLEATQLLATVAQTLHYAHKKGVVHRDIKPGNILLEERSGEIRGAPVPYIADFGLALHEKEFGEGARIAGTPVYMSPEQARGEGHRVDGRSDIFSLGVVFYELLTGVRPFHSDSLTELLEQIAQMEARPPRQRDETIPRELERICLKALSKRASERYTTAKDMADDLRHFLEKATDEEKLALSSSRIQESANAAGAIGTQSVVSTPVPTLLPTSTSDSQPIKIVPKGLQSFDATDADFFLELLPGPRDRDGLPDSIRFWKSRIEERDSENTFAVGLIYGPSGSGKSSLVKAGLLPRLPENVIAVHVDAVAEETETRLLRGVRKRCPTLDPELGIKETMTALRHGHGLPEGKKVLIILDQFEQWLHADTSRERGRSEGNKSGNAELVQALRQCDGSRLQAIIMVRDEFWMGVTRFMGQLEIDLVQGRNCAAADLFSLDHARKVLAAFGRALGKLPETSNETSEDQEEFLDHVVSNLAKEGKVICIRLSLFAEIMKGRAWNTVTLEEVGGVQRVDATFLEETFASPAANPQHRLHQTAARAVLRALLPEAGTVLKGHVRSYAELLAASGYTNRTRDFHDLLRILDTEIHLITPTDPEGERGIREQEANMARSDEVVSHYVLAASPTRSYQLTHDYLVPALRDWLTRKQKDTWRGRAELLLAERAAIWNARQENREVPSIWQTIQIRSLTRTRNWTQLERKMMRKATRYHRTRALVSVVLLTLLTWGAYEAHGRLQAHALCGHLLDADTSAVPTIIRDISPYRRWLNPLLYDARAQTAQGKHPRTHLHASLALLPADPQQVAYLYSRLLDAEPHEFPVIRDALAQHQSDLVERLWTALKEPEPGKEHQRLRAGAALATYDPDHRHWNRFNGIIVKDLVSINAIHLGPWCEAFRPVKARLLAPLSDLFRDHNAQNTAQRTMATKLLADYAVDDPRVSADLLMDADEKQFADLYPKFQADTSGRLSVLRQELRQQIEDEVDFQTRKEKLARRQANAAVALLRMDQAEVVWPLLKHSPDPRMRSYLIHRLAPLRAEISAIDKRFDEDSDETVRRALILSMGAYEEVWPSDARNLLAMKIIKVYRTEDDAGLHGAAEWLLRRWKQEELLRQTNEAWERGKDQGEKRLESIRSHLAKRATSAHGSPSHAKWYVNGQGQTLVVIPGPIEFLMGSRITEEHRRRDELQHKRRISRSFAIASKPVTKAEFLEFMPEFAHDLRCYPDPNCPIGGVTWYEAAAYCVWLSKRERIPEESWCYEVNSQGQVTKLKENYLSLGGYRLPTEAEMEYVTRAGTLTCRYYGDSEDLLGEYAWFLRNSKERTWPVGTKKPNDMGLFDLHGNVWCWCQESMQSYSLQELEVIDDDEDVLEIKSTVSRVLRGGSFYSPATHVRSAKREGDLPNKRTDTVGFRVARTVR
jgi:serine/threonine protein kinase/formylglycine-generating enzyme required for sulfatase activity